MSSFKKILATAAVSALVLTGTAGCNREATDAGGSSDKPKVMLALSTQTNPFFVQLRDGAQKKAEELGVELQVQDASDDPATQTNQLNNAATGDFDAVIVNPTDSDAVTPAVKALNTAKIPVVAVDRGVNNAEVASFVSSDNVAGGAQAAQELAKVLGDKGEVIVLQGTAGTSASRDRGKGFTEEIAKHTNIKVVAKQTAGFDRAKALDVTTNLLQAHPNAVGVFAENDEMALGASEAVGGKAGSVIKIVGFDGTADGIKAIESGKLNGTIAQQPDKLGASAVEQAAVIAKGEAAEKSVPIDVVTVTKQNVAEYK